MRLNLVLELLDVPGQLVSVLEPISGLGANLVTVIHKRDSKNENGKIPVQLTLEGEQESLNRVVERFDDLNITIIEKDGVINKELISTILIGHIVDKDVRDTTDRINSLDGENKSTALINLETDFGKKQYAFDEIAKIASEKDLLMINEV